MAQTPQRPQSPIRPNPHRLAQEARERQQKTRRIGSISGLFALLAVGIGGTAAYMWNQSVPAGLGDFSQTDTATPEQRDSVINTLAARFDGQLRITYDAQGEIAQRAPIYEKLEVFAQDLGLQNAYAAFVNSMQIEWKMLSDGNNGQIMGLAQHIRVGNLIEQDRIVSRFIQQLQSHDQFSQKAATHTEAATFINTWAQEVTAPLARLQGRPLNTAQAIRIVYEANPSTRDLAAILPVSDTQFSEPYQMLLTVGRAFDRLAGGSRVSGTAESIARDMRAGVNADNVVTAACLIIGKWTDAIAEMRRSGNEDAYRQALSASGVNAEQVLNDGLRTVLSSSLKIQSSHNTACNQHTGMRP